MISYIKTNIKKESLKTLSLKTLLYYLDYQKMSKIKILDLLVLQGSEGYT